MTYTFEQLKEDVKKEAEALRVHATGEERGNLSIDELRPSNIAQCIYGQMTGNCYSLRAATLINQCCTRYFRKEIMPDFYKHNTSLANIQKGVNGMVVKDFVEHRTKCGEVHFSAIEAYILLPEARNANLIAYLRGETETMEL